MDSRELLDESTYGNFIRMKIHVVINEMMMHKNPIAVNKILFNFGCPVGLACVLSRMTNPRDPIVKRKLDANPSIMYCPLTRYGMNATGLECPCSSTVEPILGGSTMTS